MKVFIMQAEYMKQNSQIFILNKNVYNFANNHEHQLIFLSYVTKSVT
jgi:hypothetical protein